MELAIMKEHKHHNTTLTDDACCAKHSKAPAAEHQHHHTLEFKTYAPGLFSFLMLASGMLLDHFEASFFKFS